jgi:soluble lytic murein transglycosylase-like protein
MQTTIIIGLAIGLLVYMAWAAKKPGEAMTTIQGGTQRGTLPVEGGAGTLEDLYQCHGRQKGLDPMLLKAIAIVESSENPNAKNPADPSYGLMQLLCQPDGQGGCRNQLNVIGWPPSSVEQLYDPDYSLHIGAQILRWNIDRKRGL